MRRTATPFALMALLFLAPPGRAAEKPLVLDLWPGAAPGEKGDLGPEKLLEQKPGEKPVMRLTNVSRPTMTVRWPPKDKDTGAAVLICPGGGYHVLAWDLEGEEVAEKGDARRYLGEEVVQ